MSLGGPHLPEAKAEDGSSEEGHDAKAEDEELVVVEVGGLLELVHNPEAEDEAHDEEDAKDEEDNGSDDVDDLVKGEVLHGWDGRS